MLIRSQAGSAGSVPVELHANAGDHAPPLARFIRLNLVGERVSVLVTVKNASRRCAMAAAIPNHQCAR